MSKLLKNLSDKTNVEDSKVKIFAIFKLIISIIYFIPALCIVGLGIIINLFLLIIGSGASKITDTSGFIEGMNYISLFTIFPSILALVIFVMTLIFTIQLFKDKYNKTMDLLTSVLFILINVILIIFFFKLSFYILGIVLLLFSIVLILNILVVIKITTNK